jgi:hypothetical protein
MSQDGLSLRSFYDLRSHNYPQILSSLNERTILLGNISAYVYLRSLTKTYNTLMESSSQGLFRK